MEVGPSVRRAHSDDSDGGNSEEEALREEAAAAAAEAIRSNTEKLRAQIEEMKKRQQEADRVLAHPRVTEEAEENRQARQELDQLREEALNRERRKGRAEKQRVEAAMKEMNVKMSTMSQTDQLGHMNERLEAYNSPPAVVSALMFGTALAIVLTETSEQLDAENFFVQHMAADLMHLTVGLNLFSTVVQTSVFYYGKKLLGLEDGKGDATLRCYAFMYGRPTQAGGPGPVQVMCYYAYGAFQLSVAVFSVGLIFQVWLQNPDSSVATTAALIYSFLGAASVAAMWKMKRMYDENSGLGHEEQGTESNAKLRNMHEPNKFDVAELLGAFE
jgi:flagellar biosynthesis GTPase FlhF